MKKPICLLIAVFLLVPGLSLWADATVQAGANGTDATVLFSFKAPKADKVFVAGTMNGWNATAQVMEKGADGVWTWTLNTKVSDVVKYKFVVDGAWTFDENAPDSEGDGFGGYNGVIDIDQLLKHPPKVRVAGDTAAGDATGEPPRKLKPLGFATWTRATVDTKSLTKNVKDKTIDGYEFDSLGLKTESYWKLSGDILPGVNLYTELGVANGTLTLYQANTLSSAVPITTWADGLANVSGLLFNPLYTLNSGALPTTGQFKFAVTGDWLNFYTGYNNAKGTSHAFIWNTSNYDDNNAGKGFTEFSLGKELSKIGDAKLDLVVAPNRVSGYGVYSWATLTMGDLAIDTSVNIKSNAVSVYQFWTDFKGVATLGASEKFGDFSVKLESLVNYGQWTPSLTGAQWLDNMAVALQTGYSSSIFGAAFNVSAAGKDSSTIYGKDGDLHTGNIFVELKPWVKLDPVKLGVDSNVSLTNKLDTLATSDSYLWAKPYTDIDLSKVLPINLTSSVYADVNVDLKGGTALGTKLNEVGLGVTANSLIPVLKSLTVSDALHTNYYDWDATAKTYTFKKMYEIGMVRANFDGNVSLNLGGQYQMLNADKATDTEKLQLAPLGAFVGVSWVVPSEEWKKPVAYLSVTYNMDPFDGGKDGLSMNGTDMYRPDSLDNGYGESHVRCGLIWSF